MSSRIRVRLGASYWKLFTASAISNTGDGMGLITYPWLASAVTRNPLLIGLVSVANRLPWLVFKRAEWSFLPRGVVLPPDLRADLWDSFRRPEVRQFVSRLCAGYQGTLPRLPESFRPRIFQTSKRGLAPSKRRPRGRSGKGDFGTGSTRRREAARWRNETRRAPGAFLEQAGSRTDEAARAQSRTGRPCRPCAEV